MKRICSIALMFLASAGFAAAQSGASPATDVLGAHLNYGRGCAGCHAPHNGAYGNGGAKTADLTSGQSILWGQDVASLYGQSLAFGGVTGRGSYAETLPSSMSATGPDVNGLLTCLSCHDGNYAEGAMMKDQVYETLPSTYGTFNKVPTLLGIAPGTGGAASYLQDHPVGLNAKVSCGGQYNWDCTQSATTGAISMNGPNSSKFVTNYGFFTQPTSYTPTVNGVAGTPVAVVVCTTCHNQHLMNVVKVTNGPNTGLTSGYYSTMFFINAPYNPASGTTASNQTAQFCRQCHGGEANESNNGTAVTTF